MTSPLFQLERITKRFPGVVANDEVSLTIHSGTIHAVIGENGAGKSTLMGVLFGRYQPDSGRILHQEREVRITDPSTAISLGIGMVTQHTTMIPALSALENVILGSEPTTAGGLIEWPLARRKVEKLSERLTIEVDWNSRAEMLSVAALQKAEIVKALFRGARLLILDEPTATLAPQEADGLFALLHTLVDDGLTIVFVTHKLTEVMQHSQEVTVLRGGRVSGHRPTAATTSDELLGLMLGTEDVASGARAEGRPMQLSTGERVDPAKPVLEVADLSVGTDHGALAVRGASITVMPGEVVGVAGVDGSGQRELAQAIVGLRAAHSGSVSIGGRDVTRLGVASRQREGLAYVPEDRHREGLILDFSLAENLVLGKHRLPGYGGGRTLNLKRIALNGETALRDHRIRAPGAGVAVRTLSGGNQQKVVMARALEGRPRILVAMQPTRGLDVEATRFIYTLLGRARADGMGVLLFSLDMDEIMALSDRTAVMYNGEIITVVSRKDATADAIGRIMVEGRV